MLFINIGTDLVPAISLAFEEAGKTLQLFKTVSVLKLRKVCDVFDVKIFLGVPYSKQVFFFFFLLLLFPYLALTLVRR